MSLTCSKILLRSFLDLSLMSYLNSFHLFSVFFLPYSPFLRPLCLFKFRIFEGLFLSLFFFCKLGGILNERLFAMPRNSFEIM